MDLSGYIGFSLFYIEDIKKIICNLQASMILITISDSVCQKKKKTKLA